jgi:hypothetical protein
MNCAPVVVFAYNRPLHVQATLEALAANELAAKTDLIVYADGPRNPEAEPAVQAVRAYLQTLEGFRSVTIRTRGKNWGLADSIVDGVSTVVNDCGRVIVLEDDLLTSPFFLRYMNDALDRYADEARVMHIAGHMLDLAPGGLPEAFFLRQSSCWGWGTWARAWQHFRCDPQKLLQTFSSADIHRFNLDGAYDYWTQVEANAQGSLKTWAVFWYASVFQRRGLCLHPRSSLVRNIGFDGTGTNCGGDGEDGTANFLRETAAVREFPSTLEEHSLGLQRYRGHLLGKTTDVREARLPGKWSSVWHKLAALMSPGKK